MKRGFIEEKRGLSPVIASVLLILLVLVLAALIFLWARGFISEQIEKFGKPIEELCEDVSFEAEIVESPGIRELAITNRGNVDIYHLNIKKIKGGNSEFLRFDYSIDSGESIQEKVSLQMEQIDLGDPEKIIIYPVLIGSIQGKGSNSAFTCIDHDKIVNL
tara:strand:- start:290 stop:772 length:483 start_codon:yes stop_codon:yes gene_type:complete